MDDNKRVTKAAGLISIATFISRITGYIKDMILARIFGASGMTDAFFVAFRIPNLLRDLFAEGSMSAAFVPVFTEHLTDKGREEAKRLAVVTFSFLLTILSFICILGVIFAPIIATVIAPGFLNDPEKFSMTVTLTRIMFPFLLFISLAALSMGILNSLRAFFVPAIAPVFFNLVIIASALFLSPEFDRPLLAIAIGVTLGGATQFLVQLPSIIRHGFGFRLLFNFSHPGLKRMLVLLLPAVLGMAVAQINIFLSTIFASYLPHGSVTYLYYGMRLIHFPIGIFGIAMSMAVLPVLSEQAVKKEMHKLRDTFSFSLRLLFFITIPAMAGLIALGEPIVNLLFQRGRFTYMATIGTTEALFFYSLGLWAFVGVRIVASTFYSMKDTRTPVFVAVLSVLVNITFSLILMGPLRHGGLALANSIASAVNFSVLFFVLRKRLGRLDTKRILRSFMKISIASLIMGILGHVALHGDMWKVTGMAVNKAGLLIGTIIVCLSVYLFLMYVLKSDELKYLLELRRGKE